MADNDTQPAPGGEARHAAADDPGIRLRQMIAGYQVSQAIHVAAVLGVADLLEDGPQETGWLAEQTGSHEDTLYRLLRSLAGVGIFVEVEPRRFGLSPLAEPLLTDRPGSARGAAIMHGQDWFWKPWGRLRESVMTGGSMFEAVVGRAFYELLQADPGARKIVHTAMTVSNVPAAIADTYDFSWASRLVDVAGGDGTVLAAILSRHPHLRAVQLDQPGMIEVAKRNLAAAGVQDRCEFVAGDFFESVPSCGDLYLLCQIIHNWDDPPATQILATCRRAIGPGCRVLVVERVLPPRDRVLPGGPLIDLNMLVLMSGRERTEEEYEALLAKAGLRMTRVQPAPDMWSLIEAEPA